MGPMPVTLTGKRYIILAVDFFTKYPEVIAVEDADEQTIAKFLHSDLICRHGVPKEIISDRGTEFLNELIREMEQTYHIKHIRTTLYHPQGNGQVESTNKSLLKIIKRVLDKNKKEWDSKMTMVVWADRVTS